MNELDRILTFQLIIAWAGESPRLGWWRTDLVDPAGGGDLWARLAPRTAPWAALEAAREIGRLADARARRRVGAAGQVIRSLFHLGPLRDEQLAARLVQLKRSGVAPSRALPQLAELDRAFDRERFSALLGGRESDGAHVVEPGGRRLNGVVTSCLAGFIRLARALLPLSATYPFPFYLCDALEAESWARDEQVAAEEIAAGQRDWVRQRERDAIDHHKAIVAEILRQGLRVGVCPTSCPGSAFVGPEAWCMRPACVVWREERAELRDSLAMSVSRPPEAARPRTKGRKKAAG